ncbi:hypothetical protein Tco_1421204 [Tanacetum coccineum]
MVECITASNILVVDGEKLTRFLREKISLMFSRRTLQMFHHLSTSVHVFFAISHLTNKCSSVSISSLHIGHRIESKSISLFDKFDLVGILWFTTLQLVMLTFFGTRLFQLVVGAYEIFKEFEINFLIPLTEKILELSIRQTIILRCRCCRKVSEVRRGCSGSSIVEKESRLMVHRTDVEVVRSPFDSTDHAKRARQISHLPFVMSAVKSRADIIEEKYLIALVFWISYIIIFHLMCFVVHLPLRKFYKELEAEFFGSGAKLMGLQLLQLELRLGKIPSRSFRPVKSAESLL